MKKNITGFISIICMLILFASCGAKLQKDDCGCFADFNSAKTYAQKKNVPVLIIVTSEGDDDMSTKFVNDLIKTADFKSNIASKYAVFHADFSAAAFEKTTAADTASKEEKAAAEKYAQIMQNNYQTAILLDVMYTPSVYISTKEGYIVSEVELPDDYVTYSQFVTILEKYNDTVLNFNRLVKNTKKGSSIDKVEAIDSLYMATNKTYRSFLLDLAKKVPDLDKKNETGLCSKYIVAAAESEATAYYSKGDLSNAVKTYLVAADNSFVKNEDKQECFYTAAYLIAYSGSEDYASIMEYLNMAYKIAPESEKASAIKEAISYFETVISNVNEASSGL